jgi:hypothetical protein
MDQQILVCSYSRIVLNNIEWNTDTHNKIQSLKYCAKWKKPLWFTLLLIYEVLDQAKVTVQWNSTTSRKKTFSISIYVAHIMFLVGIAGKKGRKLYT